MAIRGQLSEASLADVLQLLALGQKTGCLSLARDQRLGSIHFCGGRVVFAEVVNWRDRVGDRLVRAGALDADALAHLAAGCPHGDDRALIDALAAAGQVDAEVLAATCREHIEEAVYQLFTWTHGTFVFEAEPGEAARDSVVSISADALLLEGARRIDEWSLIERRIPSLDLIFELDEARLAHGTLALNEDQQRIRPWLDGVHDVHAIIARSGLGEFAVGKALYGLLTAGLAQPVGRNAARREPPPENRLAEHRNLGVAFYRAGLLDEAAREFARVLEMRDADLTARRYIGLVHLRRGAWDQGATVLAAAAADPEARGEVLHALAYAYERLGRWPEALEALDEAARRGAANDPRLALSRAVVALRAGDLARADAQLTVARECWGARQPSAAWYHTAALVAARSGDLARATELLEAGIVVHPHAAVLHNNLAVVHERRGRHELAARTIEHALLADANLPQLHKNLGDYLYRAQRYEDAFEAFTRVVRLDPRHGSDVWLKLGNIHFRRGDLDQARQAWLDALALDPDNRIVQANLRGLRRSGQAEATPVHATPVHATPGLADVAA